MTTVFHRNYKGGLVKWILDYKDTFTELVIFAQKYWDDDDAEKRRLIQKGQNIGLLDAVIEELVTDKSYLETCNFLREKTARKMQNISQTSNLKSLTLSLIHILIL
jgi:hypothetical protein